MFRKALPILVVLTLALSACSFHISLPITQETGPTQTDEISLSVPADVEVVNLSLSFGAGTLKLHPGTDMLVAGTASYNVEDFQPEITVEDGNVKIEQGNWKLTGIPDVGKIKNEWNLSLGPTPINLNIEAGAYKAEYDFGGLALTNLTVSDGAAEAELTFSSPNLAEMSLLSYSTGASNISLTGLGNANFSAMTFSSGAGNYTLDFTGSLQRDASVNIETGVSNLTLIIPEGIPVQITVEGGLSNISHGAGWEKNNNVYTQAGTGPQLTIVVQMGAGNLTITK